jgi:uncharacterized repeat protein (TIGR01451 family)
MKSFPRFRKVALLGAGLIVVCSRADAQGFGLSATASADSILVNNPLTYTIDVTNLTGFDLVNTLVSNVLPASVQFQSATYSQGSYSTNGNGVLFGLGTFFSGQIAHLTVTVNPTAAGFITNTVTVTSITVTNTASTNVVVEVTNLLIQADLGVIMTGPRQAVITNDLMSYGVTVTNAGPSSAPSVSLTNTLPTGVVLKGIFPTNQPYTLSASNLIFNLGTMANGGSTNLQFTVEPTNSGTLTFSASVGTSASLDTNLVNNTASTNVPVINYLPGQLVAVTNSAQLYNPQNGLVEQSITVMNVGTNAVAAARVVVTGLTNRLFNAVGTNNGNPFVVYGAGLAANQSVDLLLQFAARSYFPFTNGQLQAFAVPRPDWTPPPATTGTNVISRIVPLANGNMLIEWPSTQGRSYTVVYSDNVLFSNAMIAPPSIVAPANQTQWIDYGPPTTVSAPTNASARFYRVLRNP